MKAILIDPQAKTVEEVNYEVQPGIPEETLIALLGDSIDYGGKRITGDTLFIMEDMRRNLSYNPFRFISSDTPFFGKVAIVNFSIETCEFADCRELADDVRKDVDFCLIGKTRRHRKELY